jgi:hypothetical protein
VVWLATAFFAFLLGLVTKPTLRLWREGHEPPAWQSKPLWWRRSIPTVVAIGWLMILGVALTPIAVDSGGVLGAFMTLLLAITLAAILLGFVFWGLVALFGRPATLVPPSLRQTG